MLVHYLLLLDDDSLARNPHSLGLVDGLGDPDFALDVGDLGHLDLHFLLDGLVDHDGSGNLCISVVRNYRSSSLHKVIEAPRTWIATILVSQTCLSTILMAFSFTTIGA